MESQTEKIYWPTPINYFQKQLARTYLTQNFLREIQEGLTLNLLPTKIGKCLILKYYEPKPDFNCKNSLSEKS